MQGITRAYRCIFSPYWFIFHLLCVLQLCAFFPANVYASSFTENPLFGDCRAGYWSSNRHLDDQSHIPEGSCWINWRPALHPHARLGFNARLGVQQDEDGTKTHGRVREALIDIDAGDLNLRAGRQIIAWGRADRINPTDYFSPRDFTLFTVDDDEQRNGLNAVQARYALNQTLTLTGVVADFQAHRLPMGRFNKLGALAQNVQTQHPPKQAQWAIKLDHSGKGVDGSISYFSGYDPMPHYGAEILATGLPLLHREYPHTQILGADFAFATGAWTMRGEFSHAQISKDCDSCLGFKRKVSRAVLGVDRDFLDTANINLQVFTTRRQHVEGAVPALRSSLKEALLDLNSEWNMQDWGLTMRLSNKFLNEKLKIELGAMADMRQYSFLWRPRMSYAINDFFRVDAGIDQYTGPARSFFGARKKNSTVFMEMRVMY